MKVSIPRRLRSFRFGTPKGSGNRSLPLDWYGADRDADAQLHQSQHADLSSMRSWIGRTENDDGGGNPRRPGRALQLARPSPPPLASPGRNRQGGASSDPRCAAIPLRDEHVACRVHPPDLCMDAKGGVGTTQKYGVGAPHFIPWKRSGPPKYTYTMVVQTPPGYKHRGYEDPIMTLQ